MKWIENQKKIQSKTVEILYDYLCVVVCVCVCVCVGYSCVLMCVCMSLSEFTNAARCISGCEFVGVS